MNGIANTLPRLLCRAGGGESVADDRRRRPSSDTTRSTSIGGVEVSEREVKDPGMEPQPEVRYARSGDARIAYQVLGEGSIDLVYLPPWGNLVWNWEWPPYARFLRRLASFSRLIVMDRRGFGCSAGTGLAPSLEVEVDDLFAVIEEAQGPPPAIFGADGGFVPLLAAATHPERVAALVLFHGQAAGTRSEEQPWLLSADEWDGYIGMHGRVASTRERVQQYVRVLEPSLRDDPGYLEWALRMFPLNCTPETWVAYWSRYRATDVTTALPSIRVPTLVVVRPRVQASNAEMVRSSRFLAERIPNAKLVELPGEDMNPWVGEADPVADAIESFLIGAPTAQEPTRALATVLFTDIVDSTRKAASIGDARWKQVLAAHHERGRAAIAAHRGREIETTGDGFLATFDGPARAVACATEICAAVRDLDLEVRAGCHTGEVERSPAGIHGIAVHIGARVAALAGPGEVLVSQTVRDLTAGSGIVFADAGEHELKGVPDRWALYRVVV
jgi:class 3 adenylate cyclase